MTLCFKCCFLKLTDQSVALIVSDKRVCPVQLKNIFLQVASEPTTQYSPES